MFATANDWGSESDTDVLPPAPTPAKKTSSITAAPPARAADISSRGTAVPAATGAAAGLAPTGFHAPSHPQFARVTLPLNTKVSARSVEDAAGIGATWGQRDCCCVRCEVLKVSRRLSAMMAAATAAGAAAPTVVLLDADNYGFPQFAGELPTSELLSRLLPFVPATAGPGASSAGARRARDEDRTVAASQATASAEPGVFVWAFYGANFATRFRGTDLRDYLDNLVRARRERHEARCQTESRQSAGPSVYDTARAVRGARSVWGALTAADAVHATRCAGASQAADEVMLSAAAALRDEPLLRVVLLTGDRELRRNIVEQLLPGRAAPFMAFDVRGRAAAAVWGDVHSWLTGSSS